MSPDSLQHMESLAARLLALLIDPFIQFLFRGSLFWWPYLLTTAGVALCGFWLARGGGWATVGEFRRRFLSRRIWAHPSSQADYGYYIVNSMLHPMIVAPLIISGAALGTGVAGMLGWVFGPMGAPVLGITAARVIYTVLFFVAYDYARYLAHGLLHDVPVLWQFHKLHHSAEVLTPFTTYRAHPVELFLMAAVPNLATGLVSGIVWYVAADAIGFYTFLGAHVFMAGFNAIANLRHCEVWISFGPMLNRWLISPAHHQIHHSCDPRHFGRNRGFELAIWDRLCGTLFVPGAAEPLRLGLGDGTDGAWHSVGRMYGWPFRDAFALFGWGHAPALSRMFSRRATARVSGLARQMWHDRRGNYSMIVVLLLPVLTGFVGVGTEMGLWLYDQQSQQTATDAAAFSAATYYKSQSPVPNGNTTAGPNGQAQALAVAASYGFPDTAVCATQDGVSTCLSPPNCSVDAPGVAAACVQVNNPPVAGTQAGNAAAFEVIIAQSPQQLFSKVLISTPVVIKARTVGVVNGQSQQIQSQTQAPCTGTSCVCIKVANAANLADSANFTGSANLTLNGCSLEVDDTGAAGLNLSGSAVVSASDIYLANANLQYSSSGTACTAANQGAKPCNAVTGMLAAPPPGGFTDPYQAQLGNTIPIIMSGSLVGCQSASAGIGGSTLGPNLAGGSIYFSQIRIASNTVLRAGTYYICPGGNVTISGGSTVVSTAPFPLASGCTSPYTSCNGAIPFAAGDGVTLVLLGLTGSDGTVANCAYFSISGGASLELVPPQTGPFAGIVLTSSINCTPPAIGASGNMAGTATISGGAATQLFGAVDLPDYSITYSGNSSAGTGGCLNIIANSFSITGAASISITCAGVGTSGIGPPTTTTTTTTTTVYTASLAN